MDGETQREYKTNTIKTCLEFDKNVAFSFGPNGEPLNDEVYDKILKGMGLKEPDPTPSATPTPTPAPTATPLPTPTPPSIPTPTPRREGGPKEGEFFGTDIDPAPLPPTG